MYFLKTLIVLIFVCTSHSVLASDESFSVWSSKVVAKAKAEASSVKSPAAARLWASRYVMPLYDEAMPPYTIGVGVIKAGSYGIMLRVWDDEDSDLINKSFGQMIDLLLSVRKSVGGDFPEAQYHESMLNTYREKVLRLCSPEVRYMMEQLDKLKY